MSTGGDDQFIQDLTRFIPLNALNPENLAELAVKAKKRRVAKGALLFKAGQRDAYHVFLLAGTVELSGADGTIKLVKADTAEARLALAHNQPRSLDARSKTDVTIVQVNSELLDIMLTWDQTGGYEVRDLQNESNVREDTGGDWMTHILQTKAFHRIPPANIQAMFMRLESVTYSPGDVIIKQEEDGDYFYLIKEGRCMVTRKVPSKTTALQLAELGPGDSFGEEALISDDKRNATITMLTKGTMMRLSKADFMSLLNEPLLSWLAYDEAAAKNGVWLDVRLPSEFQNAHIKDAKNIPLIFLRMKMNSLDESKPYVLYCDTGRRSSAASFLLSERGFEVYILKDGINSAPGEVLVASA